MPFEIFLIRLQDLVNFEDQCIEICVQLYLRVNILLLFYLFPSWYLLLDKSLNRKNIGKKSEISQFRINPLERPPKTCLY